MNDAFPQEIWDHELMANPEPAVDWLWYGLLATGNLTLLTGLWKLGKTTLLSLLLSRRKQGGRGTKPLRSTGGAQEGGAVQGFCTSKQP
jgi:hypothetical protein